ncbi:MAG: rhomboid family intramembrane serine protease [Proteobacteria bacterium]|nr:rhomboid family intramembrane serine protease [Pseudomonadota bacterium]MBU1594389.1 rhomboid family intramembrane serine protease [Pseudomonadota bacterium]
MIPLRDEIPRVHTPYAVILVILANVGMHVLLGTVNPFAQEHLYHLFGVVPARYLFPDWAAFVGFPAMGALPFLTYMFLHGSWWHLLMNMWMLWIFADNIEDVMGPGRFLGFYLLCGLSALALHLYFNTTSTMPIIGASGAVAGVMGAYILLYPRGRVLTFIPIIIIPYIVRLPAWLFLGFWFLTQILSGLFEGLTGHAQGIAWWAHVGGFVAGMVLVRLFMKPERCYYCEYKGANQDFRFE